MTRNQGRTIVVLLIAVILLQVAALSPREAQPWIAWPAVLLAVARLAYVILTTPTGRARSSLPQGDSEKGPGGPRPDRGAASAS